MEGTGYCTQSLQTTTSWMIRVAPTAGVIHKVLAMHHTELANVEIETITSLVVIMLLAGTKSKAQTYSF